MEVEQYQFGQGLETIETKLQSSKDLQSTLKIGSEKEHEPVQQVQSKTTKIQSNQLIKKIFSKKITQTQLRSTGKNFFKRSANLTISQAIQKAADQQVKQNKESKKNLNPTVSDIKKRDNRQTSSANSLLKLLNRKRNSFLPNKNNNLSMICKSGTLQRKEGTYLTLPNNLTQLMFKYNGGYATALFNYQLKIKNQSLTKHLAIKIKCTSPIHYQIRPSHEAQLNPGQILSFTIEMKLFPHDLNVLTMKHDLSRYKTDKFQIIYWTKGLFGDSEYYQGHKILNVKIEETEYQKLRNQGLTQNISAEKLRQATEQQSYQFYQKFIEKNNLKSEEIDNRKKQLETLLLRSHYFSKKFFIFIGLIGIAIGFWFG